MASNTLILYGLEAAALASVATELETTAGSRELVKLVHLKSFGRILTVFTSPAAAAQARGRLKDEYSELKIAEGEYTDVYALPHYLELPDPGRLWLTSPPGSPPADWEPKVEEEPNQAVNFDPEFSQKLGHALHKLATEREIGSDEACSCTIYQSPVESMPAIKIDWENCTPATPSSTGAIPRTAIPF